MSLDRFADVITAEQQRYLEEQEAKAKELLAGRVVWNVNSTARGGGVAEMLHSLIAYARATGVDARWVVIGGEPDFFRVTKRIHNNLHGHAGDGGAPRDPPRPIYQNAAAADAQKTAPPPQPRHAVLA